MGMFDYLVVDINILPHLTEEERDKLGNSRIDWQTKDFECELTHVYIVEDIENKFKHSFLKNKTPYKLQIKRFDWEEVPKSERPYPDAEEGTLEALVGSVKEVNLRIEDLDYTGTFRFYTYIKRENQEVGSVGKLRWIEFECEVENGKIISIKRFIEIE